MTLPTDSQPITHEEKLEVVALLTASGGPFDDNSGASVLLRKLLKMELERHPDEDYRQDAVASSLHVSGNQIAVYMSTIRKLLKARYSADISDGIEVFFPIKSYKPEFRRREVFAKSQRIKFAIESWNGPRVWKEVIEPCEQKKERGTASVFELSCIAAALIQAGYWGDHSALTFRERAIAASKSAIKDLAFNESKEVASIAYLGKACVSAVFEHDFRKADIEFRTAIEKDPKNPFARAAYATNVLSPTRRFDEAVQQAKLGLNSDPTSPFTNSALAWMHFYSDRYDLAIKHWQDALYFFPDGFSPKYGLACVYGEMGQWNKCFEMLEHILKLWTDQPYIRALKAHYLARKKDFDAARQVLHTLTEGQSNDYISPYGIGMIHAGLGENDDAFKMLYRAKEDWDVRLTYFDIAPAWKGLRRDERYRKFGKELGLLQFQ